MAICCFFFHQMRHACGTCQWLPASLMLCYSRISYAAPLLDRAVAPAPACRYLPVLQFVTLLTTPATALYAIGGLLASPLIVPAIIIKNLVALVGQHQALNHAWQPCSSS